MGIIFIVMNIHRSLFRRIGESVMFIIAMVSRCPSSRSQTLLQPVGFGSEN